MVCVDDAFYAVKLLRFNKFKKYIEFGNISINTISEQDETFLMTHLRVHNEPNYSFMFYFLSNGIDVNYRDDRKRTALMYAIDKGMYQYAIDMLQFYYNYNNADNNIKFNVNIQDDLGQTALMFVVNDYTRNNEVTKEELIINLFRYGANDAFTNFELQKASDITRDLKLKQLILNSGNNIE